MKRRAYLYFVITFVIGIIVGGFAVYTYAWNSGRWRRRWNEEKALHNVQRQLGLSALQVAELKSIWEQTGKAVHALQAQSRPQIEAVRRQTEERIRGILTPVQITKYDEMLRQRRRAPPPRRR
ncbi:MAG: hypothetical protein ACRD3D_12155 [Terriglobia bacterium]